MTDFELVKAPDFTALLDSRKIEDIAILKGQFGAYAGQISEMLGKITVDSEDTQKDVTELVLNVDKFSKAVDKWRKDKVGPFNEFVKEINGECKYFTDIANNISIEGRRKLKVYSDKIVQERKRLADEERKRQEEEQRRIKAEFEDAELRKMEQDATYVPEECPEMVVVDVPQGTKTVRTAAGATTIVSRWTFEVTDINLVPRRLLVLNDRAVKDAIKAGTREIPGLRIYTENTVRISR